MKRIAVTGGSGKAGRVVVKDLLEHGYQVVNVDVVPPAENLTRFRQVDLTQLGEVFEALDGVDAVVHLAPSRTRTALPQDIFFKTTPSAATTFSPRPSS